MQLKDLDWKGIGESVAKLGLPLLGSAIAGPAGGAVGAALASAIPGGEKAQSPQDVVQLLSSSADALQKAKEFEATHQEKLLQMQLDTAVAEHKAEVEDRNSARNRDVAIVQATGKNKRGDFLAYAAVFQMYLIEVLLFASAFGQITIPDAVERLLYLILGALLVTVKDVYGFEFGSSKDSQRNMQAVSDALKNQ